MAQPGEFTKRAFLNGRIDLTQAEAVIDLIRAKTTTSLEIANQQLEGHALPGNGLDERGSGRSTGPDRGPYRFSGRGDRKGLFEEIAGQIDGAWSKNWGWIASYEEGRIFREGISCAIIGKTNVGKSSLLNVLLKEDRAIVTPVPGTTRDVIEEVS